MAAEPTFGTVLNKLLFESNLHSLSEWATLFEASAKEIISWKEDKQYPTPAQLAKLMDIIRSSRPQMVKDYWNDIAQKPMRDVVSMENLLPINYRGVSTLAMYELWGGEDGYDAALHKLGRFPYEKQRAFLKFLNEEVIPGLESEQ
jgi:hypothetical protein